MEWYSPFPEEIDKIIELAGQRPTGTKIVEVGVYRGYTTVRLAQAFPDTIIYAVDRWDGYQDTSSQSDHDLFVENTRHFPHIRIWKGPSQDCPPFLDVGFVFHDGDHRRPDFQKWYQVLVRGGILVCHDVLDSGWPNVRKVFDTLPDPKRVYSFDRPTTGSYSAGARGLGVVRK